MTKWVPIAIGWSLLWSAPFLPANRVVNTDAGGASYLLSEDFETTGTPTGWSVTFGTPDFDDSTTGSSPLAGSESAYFDSGESARSVAFTASGNCYVYCVIELGAASGGVQILRLQDSGPTTRCAVEFRPGGFLRIIHGSTSSDGSTVVSSSVVHVWFEYEKGTGSNGVARLYYSGSASTKTLEATVTTGNATADVQYFMGLGATNGTLLDTVRVSSSPIGTNPS